MDIPWAENKMLTMNTLLNLFAQLWLQTPASSPPYVH